MNADPGTNDANFTDVSSKLKCTLRGIIKKKSCIAHPSLKQNRIKCPPSITHENRWVTDVDGWTTYIG